MSSADAPSGNAYERHLAEVTERNEAARKAGREKRTERERETELARRRAENALDASMPRAGGQDGKG